jgi:hypothetical protein
MATPETISGKVSRIITDEYQGAGRTIIRLADLPEEKTPKDFAFIIPKEHVNYNALVSLALIAATNRYDLSIRTRDAITNDDLADVWYLWVEWK